MLKKQYLRGSCFVGKPGLGFLSLLAAEGRVGQDDIEQRGGLLK